MSIFDLPPIQEEFDEDDIRNMTTGRRQLKTEWQKALYKPDSPDKDWCVILPFPNTFQNAFFSTCRTDAYAHQAPTGKLCLYLRGIGPRDVPPEEVANWIETVGRYVAMKDFLALSFALDYEREHGDPLRLQTTVGALRARAKPYDRQPTADTLNAAKDLSRRCMEFLNEMACYHSTDCVVAMPPSDPTKKYNLPLFLAKQIAKDWGKEDLTNHVRTIKPRESVRTAPLDQKLDRVLGTIGVDEDAFQGRTVLLVDDLYQSGRSLNYCGLMLLRAGALKVFGLACEKTCRNDDNVSGDERS